MRVNWTEQAMGLLVAAVEHYAKAHDPVKAYQTFDQVIDRAKALGDHPGIGRRGRVAGTKEFVLKGTPFILVYQVSGDQVDILRVLHGSQAWLQDKPER